MVALGLTVAGSAGIGVRRGIGVQHGCHPGEPQRIDDVVLVAQRRRVVGRIEAVDLALGLVGIVEPDREHRARRGGWHRSRRRRRPTGRAGWPAPPRPATVKPRWSSRPRSNIVGPKPWAVGVVAGHLEDVEHDLAGGEHGLASVAGSGAEDQRRLEADDVLVERAVAVQIARHHSDVADPARHARRARDPSRLPTPRRRSPGWNDSFRAVRRAAQEVAPSAVSTRHDSAADGLRQVDAVPAGADRLARGGRRAAAPGRRSPRSLAGGCAPR